MSRDLKHYLDNFDTELLDSYENVLYNELRRNYPHRLSLIKLVLNYNPQSYALYELKELIKENDKNIKNYE